ncbi:MAG TPA: hypothetical protein VKV96_20840 [Roseiarcus sp.]|nr:hypothetical protein [Roseiarcus sp.]
MFDLWRARRARRAATVAIAPLVEATRRRCDGIPDTLWLDSYVIGFLATLITLFGTRRSGPLAADALAAAQSGAWSDITQTSGELAGEQICYFSLAQDTTFLQGCADAERFFHKLVDPRVEATASAADPADLDPPMVQDGMTLWAHYFERRLYECRP